MEEMLFYRTKPEERETHLRQRHWQDHHCGGRQDSARRQARQSHHHRDITDDVIQAAMRSWAARQADGD